MAAREARWSSLPGGRAAVIAFAVPFRPHRCQATPMPERLLLFGGTFDPPHLGHLILGECAAHQLDATVTFLPAGDPWRKTSTLVAASSVTHAHHRTAMLRLAIEANPAFRIDDREVRRDGPTYTIDTLEELHQEGFTDIVLILGADALDDLPNWHSPERIQSLATLAVAPRYGPAPSAQPNVITVDMPPVAISATHIRQRVAQSKTIRYLVPDAVERYILTHNLYRE